MNHHRFNLTHTALGAAILGLCMHAHAGETCATMNTSIPDNSVAGVSIPIELTGGAGEVIDSIEVSVAIAHPWVGDLVITLSSPSGSLITLLDRPGIPSVGFPGPFGCGGRDIDAVFSDGGALAAEDVCSFSAQPVITGTVRPAQPLAGFVGEPAVGTWVVTVSDRSAFDAGQVTQVCLSVTTSQSCAPDFTGDGVLDFFDVSMFLNAFSAQDPAGDFNGDGLFDFFDVSVFLNAFSAGCP